MTRLQVAVEEPKATVMRCEDARDGLAAVVRGQVRLTEWALLEAHLKQCAECRQAEAHLRELAAASRPVTPPRAVLASLREAVELARIGVIWSTVLRRRALLTAAFRELTPRATAGVTRALALAVGHSADLMARVRASLASVQPLAARAVASAWRALGLAVSRFIAGVAHLRASLAIPLRSSVAAATVLVALRLRMTRSVKRASPFRSSVQAVGVVLALAFTLYALQRTDGPQLLARPPAPVPELEPTRLEPAQVEPAQAEPGQPEPTRLEPAEAETAQLVPSPPEPSVEKKTVPAVPPRIDEQPQPPSEALPRAAALSPPDRSAAGPFGGVASSPPTPLSELPVSATHVVGRLSAKNPGAGQRDFIALLAEVGGTELGRSHRVRFTTVEVVVPQSRYNEFTDGLARIGSWRLEAARSPLPDAVRMTIRVSE